MNYVCPLIVVKDIKIAKEFYQNVLGQKLKYDFGENVTFEGDFSIHLQDHYESLLGIGHNNILKRSNNFELYFETEKIEIIYRKLKELGVEFIHELNEQPWGQRVVRFYDPDFHIIEVGEPMESVVIRYIKSGMNLEDICIKTSLPKEFVQKVKDGLDTKGNHLTF